MTINSVSNANMATTYQKVENNQELQQQQRVQRKDGSGQGKQLNKAQNQSNIFETAGNYTKDSGTRTNAIESSFDMSV